MLFGREFHWCEFRVECYCFLVFFGVYDGYGYCCFSLTRRQRSYTRHFAYCYWCWNIYVDQDVFVCGFYEVKRLVERIIKCIQDLGYDVPCVWVMEVVFWGVCFECVEYVYGVNVCMFEMFFIVEMVDDEFGVFICVC